MTLMTPFWQRAARLPGRVGLALLTLLALTLPFETAVPFTWTNGRLTYLGLLLGALFTAVLFSRRPVPARPVSRPWFWLGLLFALALLLSAWWAPDFKANAWRGALRLLAGLALAVATWRLVQNRRQAHLLLAAVALGGLAVALVGLLEVSHGQPLAWLSAFRAGPTLAGPFLRLSGPFNHANQAAIYLEATLPIWLCAAAWSWRQRRWGIAAVAIGASLLLFQATLLTYSRAAWLVLLLVGPAVVGRLQWPPAPGWWGRARPIGLLLAPALAIMALNSWFNPVFAMRLLSQDDADWYQVALQAPDRLQIGAGQIANVTVGVRHSGRLPWPATPQHPIRLAARWYRETDNQRLKSEGHWSLATLPRPGEAITVTVSLPTPALAGDYRLEWDLVQEDITWFSQKNGALTVSRVQLLPSLVSAPLAEDEFVPPEPVIPPLPRRATLWGIAWQQFMVYPWSGIGPDNFRLTYGRFLAWQHWNNAVHTHNWYLEMLVSLGIIGALPFFAGLALLGRHLLVTLRRPRPALGQIAVAAALIAYGLHGWVDYFWMDSGTGLLFWLLLGLWAAQAQFVSRRPGQQQPEK